MRVFTALIVALCPVAAGAQAVQSGAWDVTSTVVDLTVPGVPRFLVRMAHGKSRAEHKRVAASQGLEALLAPDPKAGCSVDNQRIADGRYTQALTCPQKRGAPMHISRAGTFDAGGFAGRATITGTAPKGAVTIILDQRATRVGD